jgi:hypothetical protein
MKHYRVALITVFPPLEDNHNAPNSLPYQLILNRPSNVEIDIFYYEQEGVSSDSIDFSFSKLRLNKVTNLSNAKKSFFDTFRIKLFSKFNVRSNKKIPPVTFSFFPISSVIRELKKTNYDVIWLYPIWLCNWIPYLKESNLIISGMDSTKLFYERCVNLSLAKTDTEKASFIESDALAKNLELMVASSNIPVHMVGIKDAECFNFITSTNLAFYTPHPYNSVLNRSNSIRFLKAKLNLLISGDANSIYQYWELKKFIDLMVENSKLFNLNYKINFLGYGFEKYVEKLEKADFEVAFVNRVENLPEYLEEMDLQVFPLDVGTGTKGKVLHALASGTLGIGTDFAFENIHANDLLKQLTYKNSSQLNELLQDIPFKREYYQEIAKEITKLVVINHDQRACSIKFWNALFSKDI